MLIKIANLNLFHLYLALL